VSLIPNGLAINYGKPTGISLFYYRYIPFLLKIYLPKFRVYTDKYLVLKYRDPPPLKLPPQSFNAIKLPLSKQFILSKTVSFEGYFL
jgi:hypothetical protein